MNALPSSLLRIIFFSIVFAAFSQVLYSQTPGYICPPCGCRNDGKTYEHPGECPSCGMTLINKDNKSEGLNYTNLSPEEVCDLQEENSNLLFLDVRTEREFNTSPLGRIKDAKHIHVNDLESRVDELEEYKDKEIIVYCLIGIRSVTASEFLAEEGFTKINNMLGGMDLWNDLPSDSLKCKTRLLQKN